MWCMEDRNTKTTVESVLWGKNENNMIPSDVDMILEGDFETYRPTCKLETYMFLFFDIPDSVIVYLVRNVRRPTTVFP